MLQCFICSCMLGWDCVAMFCCLYWTCFAFWSLKPFFSNLNFNPLCSGHHGLQDATEDGESLLSLACSAGYYELAEVLLRMRASVEDRGIKGELYLGGYVCVQ